MALSARSVLITGASRGIGLEFVKQLVRLPKPPEVLIACCRQPDAVSDLKRMSTTHPNVHVVQMDVTDDGDIDKVVEVTKSLVGEQGLSLLINNAAVYDNKKDGGQLCLQTRQRMSKHFDVNVTSPVMVSQKFLPLLQQAAMQAPAIEPVSANRAAIVMISSFLSSQTLALDRPDYSKEHIDYRCSKTALNMAVVLMSRDLGPQGILVMGLHPGWVRTAMGGEDGKLDVTESVEACLKVIGQAGPSIHGRLTNYTGEVLPY